MKTLLEAACLHDFMYRCKEEPRDDNTLSRIYWCTECTTLLYTQIVDVGEGTVVSTDYDDEVYRLLYTRKGRAELLVALMKERGIRIPDTWTKRKSRV